MPSISFWIGRSTTEEEESIDLSFLLKIASQTWDSEISKTCFLLLVRLHSQNFISPHLRVWFHPSWSEPESLHFERKVWMNNIFQNDFQQKPDWPKFPKLAIEIGSCWLSSEPERWHWETLNRLTFFRFDACIKILQIASCKKTDSLLITLVYQNFHIGLKSSIKFSLKSFTLVENNYLRKRFWR